MRFNSTSLVLALSLCLSANALLSTGCTRRMRARGECAGQLETRDLSEIAEDLKDMVKRQTGPSSPVVLSAPSSFTCIGPTLFLGETCTAQTAICCEDGASCIGGVCKLRCPVDNAYCAGDADCTNGYTCQLDNTCQTPDDASIGAEGDACDSSANTYCAYGTTCHNGTCTACSLGNA